MPRRPVAYPDEVKRYLNGGWYEGVAFFTERNSGLARSTAELVRKRFGVSCRVGVVPRSLQYPKRYVILLPRKLMHKQALSFVAEREREGGYW